MDGVSLKRDLKFILRECGHWDAGLYPYFVTVPDSPAVIKTRILN